MPTLRKGKAGGGAGSKCLQHIYDRAHGENELHRYGREAGKGAGRGRGVVLVAADGSTRTLLPELAPH